VDRLVVKPGIEKRLADSLETAFRYGGELVKVEQLDDAGKVREEQIFSQRLACADCGVSYPELAPRMFSFNSPHGACPTCSGLGVERVFDADRVVPDDAVSLAAGAIAPWGPKPQAYMPLLDALAKHYRVRTDTPWGELPKAVRQAIL